MIILNRIAASIRIQRWWRKSKKANYAKLLLNFIKIDTPFYDSYFNVTIYRKDEIFKIVEFDRLLCYSILHLHKFYECNQILPDERISIEGNDVIRLNNQVQHSLKKGVVCNNESDLELDIYLNPLDKAEYVYLKIAKLLDPNLDWNTIPTDFMYLIYFKGELLFNHFGNNLNLSEDNTFMLVSKFESTQNYFLPSEVYSFISLLRKHAQNYDSLTIHLYKMYLEKSNQNNNGITDEMKKFLSDKNLL
jgi:hypothetical protein